MEIWGLDIIYKEGKTMFKNKKKILCILSLSVFTNIAYAGIPGITEPYDPPNYYSPTSVSVPDSEPSPFALKDLARQGYQVHDVTNNKKDIISDIKSYTEYLQVLSEYTLNLSDLLHNDETDSLQKQLEISKKALHKLTVFNDKAQINDIDKYLYTTSSVNSGSDIKRADKYSYLGNVYQEALSTAREEENSIANEQVLTEFLLNKLNKAKSSMDVKEANGFIEVANQIDTLKQQQLINLLTAITIAQIKDENDENLRMQKENNSFFNMKIEDPYNPSDYYKEHYKKQAGKGFVDFE